MDTGNKGALNELIASTWLLKQGYHVFRNLSAYGPVDLVAMKDDKVLLIDVKAGFIYKGKKHPTRLTKKQLALNIKVINVYSDSSCVMDENPPTAGYKNPQKFNCLQCGVEFESAYDTSKYCSVKCCNLFHRLKYRAKATQMARGALLLARS